MEVCSQGGTGVVSIECKVVVDMNHREYALPLLMFDTIHHVVSIVQHNNFSVYRFDNTCVINPLKCLTQVGRRGPESHAVVNLECIELRLKLTFRS